MRSAWLCTAMLVLFLQACRREDEELPPAYPTGAPPPGQWPGVSAPPAAAPPSAPVGAVPAFGLPCAHDTDLQCPFGRCVAGRCGGCSASGDCKPGSGCAWTPFGMACLSGAGAPPGPSFPPPAPAPPIAGGGPYAAARQACVDRTNAYRASVGAPPLARRAASEPCNDQQAQSDATTGQIHGAFGRCGEMAQNECPGWNGAPETMLQSCLADMFAEGPGEGPAHGHYKNMTSLRYREVSCGFHVAPGGRVWMIQDFYQ